MSAFRPDGALLLLAPLVGACGGGSGGGGGGHSGSPLTDLGLSAIAMQGRGELWVLQVSELGEGARDRNGDGDTDDVTLTIYDLADGSLTDLSLALATAPFALLTVGDVLVAFGVSEAGQGGTDLNGDGDADDVVLHVYDSNARAVTNSARAMAAQQPAIGAANVAFGVDEAGQNGTDLNSDGDTTDSVLHVYDSRTHGVTNAQRALTSEITFNDHAFAHTTDEPSAGADLNGDGDQSDANVFETFDVVLGGIVSVPLAVRGRPLVTGVEDWYLLADEGQEGADLDGDGDQSEGVLYRIEPHLGTQVSLGLSSADTFRSLAGTFKVAFVVQEVDAVDHNSDGDLDDTRVVLYDTVTGIVFESNLAIDPTSPLAFAGNQLALLSDEGASAHDWNLDGDQLDDVLWLMQIDSGLTIDTQLAMETMEASGALLLLTRLESEAGSDWNGDGDALDEVAFTLDASTLTLTNTHLAVAGGVQANADSLLLLARESDENRDLNDDADLDDLVYVLHERATQTNTSLRAATTVLDGRLLADGRAVLLISEAGQGADLNGDGDLDDSVLHVLE